MLIEQSPLYLESFLLILTRVSAMMLASPLFSVRGIPPYSKIGLAVFVTLIFLPLGSPAPLELAPGIFPFAIAIGRELIVGLVIGFAVTLIFTGFHMAAQMISVQIGFNVGNILDPITGFQSSPLDQFYSVFVMLIFLTINGHYQLLLGLQQSFSVVPVAGFDANLFNPESAIALSAAMFVIALRVTLPLMAALLLADLGMAIIARTMPQIPVFIVGMPMKVVVGLLVMMITLPAAALVMTSTFDGTLREISLVLPSG